MKKIRLKNSRKVTVVDDHNFDQLNQYLWFEKKDPDSRTSYAYRSIEQPDGTVCYFQMHRVIMGLSTGDGFEVDHIDGDGLNNQESNLRVATRSENLANKGRYRNSTSGFKGASLHRNAGKWLSTISFARQQYYLGLYPTAAEAGYAYNLAAAQLHRDLPGPTRSRRSNAKTGTGRGHPHPGHRPVGQSNNTGRPNDGG